MAVSDDDIIKRKLLIEGDGGNDERRISSLLKTFINWSTVSDTEEEGNSTYQRMLSTLTQCEHAVTKSFDVYSMNVKEQQHYKKLNKQIESKVQNGVEQIQKCKQELLAAKQIRRNRQEYDALAKVIQQNRDRQTTTQELEEIRNELALMKDTTEALEQKLELRRKQFHVLIAAIHEMQRILEKDEQGATEAMEAVGIDVDG